MSRADRRQQALNRWKRHLDAAAASGQSVAAYARAHGLNRKSLYWAGKQLRESPDVPAKKAARAARTATARRASAFVPVEVIAGPAHRLQPRPSSQRAVRALLPNGIVLECDACDVEALLLTLVALPCSGSMRA
ncbi:MAG TPA: hypothetical protein VFB54_20705 [Burkholderiales bacterium]|nr:hypothetical protein [Burkholderiales bacterium]